MGGGGTTTGAVNNSNSSSESVPAKLLDNAKKQLKAKGKSIPDGTSWDAAVELLAEMCFENNYPYAFHASAPKPPQAAPDTDVSALRKFCSVETNSAGINTKITNYIKTVMLKDAKVPVKMQEEAIRDLSDVALSLVDRRATNTNEWYEDRYTRTFQRDQEEDAISGNTTAVQVDGVFLYCNSLVTSGGKTEQLLIIYYMAVYYWVASDTTKQRAIFEREAFAQAKQITGTTYMMRDESDLRQALQSHFKDEFKKRFGYEYENNQPNALKTVRSLPLWTSSSLNRAERTEWVKNLANIYCQNFGSRDKAIAESIQERLKEQLGNFVSRYPVSSNGTWTWQQLEVTRDPSESEKIVNSVVFNGFVYYFTNTATTGKDYDVSLTYVMIMGVAYETQSLGETVMGDLYEQLIQRLPDIKKFSHRLPDMDTKSRSTFEELTLENAKLLFNKKHRFDWKESNPRVPAKNEKVVKTFQKLFDLNNEFGTDAIEDKVNELFERDETFGRAGAPAVERLYDDFVKKIKSCTDATSGRHEMNQWQVDSTNKEFSDGKEYTLKHYAVFLFVFGTGGVGATSTRQFFLQYLSVITVKE